MTPELLPVWCWPGLDSFSSTVTECPRRVSSKAVASPTIPAPATMTWLPIVHVYQRWGGLIGLAHTHPRGVMCGAN